MRRGELGPAEAVVGVNESGQSESKERREKCFDFGGNGGFFSSGGSVEDCTSVEVVRLFPGGGVVVALLILLVLLALDLVGLVVGVRCWADEAEGCGCWEKVACCGIGGANALQLVFNMWSGESTLVFKGGNGLDARFRELAVGAAWLSMRFLSP